MYSQNAPAMKGHFNACSWSNQARLYPLPPAEANRLRSWLNFQEPFSSLDPCTGDGVAFVHLLHNAPARWSSHVEQLRGIKAIGSRSRSSSLADIFGFLQFLTTGLAVTQVREDIRTVDVVARKTNARPFP